MNRLSIIFYCSLVLLIGCSSDDKPAPVARGYYLGFTSFPYDITTAAVDDVYAKLATDADLITHHFDNGIPWNDAMADNYPYHSNIMDDWNQRKTKTPADHNIYIAVTPIGPSRNALALLKDSDNDMALLAPFDTHATNGDFNHADVKTAFLNYCKRVIAYFEPDYFAIGIEANLLRKETDAATWAKYVELNDEVYASLKVLYPNLPIFTSVSPVEMIEGYPIGLPAEFSSDAAGYAASQVAALRDVLASSDYFAISLYPYQTAFFDTPYPADFLDTLFALSTKPIAIAETGMSAGSITAFSVTFVGSPAIQNDYLVDLFAASDQVNMEFISWFILQDYDDLCVSIGGCSDAIVLWRDTGLYDQFGNIRPGHTTWIKQLARPIQQGLVLDSAQRF